MNIIEKLDANHNKKNNLVNWSIRLKVFWVSRKTISLTSKLEVLLVGPNLMPYSYLIFVVVQGKRRIKFYCLPYHHRPRYHTRMNSNEEKEKRKYVRSCCWCLSSMKINMMIMLTIYPFPELHRLLACFVCYVEGKEKKEKKKHDDSRFLFYFFLCCDKW